MLFWTKENIGACLSTRLSYLPLFGFFLCHYHTAVIPEAVSRDLISMILWTFPTFYFATLVFPFGNSVGRAFSPHPIGSVIFLFSACFQYPSAVCSDSPSESPWSAGSCSVYSPRPFSGRWRQVLIKLELQADFWEVFPDSHSRGIFPDLFLSGIEFRRRLNVSAECFSCILRPVVWQVILFFLWCAAFLIAIAGAYKVSSESFSLLLTLATIGGFAMTGVFAQD